MRRKEIVIFLNVLSYKGTRLALGDNKKLNEEANTTENRKRYSSGTMARMRNERKEREKRNERSRGKPTFQLRVDVFRASDVFVIFAKRAQLSRSRHQNKRVRHVTRPQEAPAARGALSSAVFTVSRSKKEHARLV